MDRLESVEQIKELHAEMFAFYTAEMASLDKKTVYSKPIVLCLDYIYERLNEPIRVERLAGFSGLNASYLSTLFKKETGASISEYVLSKRMEAAKICCGFHLTAKRRLPLSWHSVLRATLPECSSSRRAIRLKHIASSFSESSGR